MTLGELCSEIVVVVAPDTDGPDLPEEVVAPVLVIRDPEPYGGPLVGLAAALTEADTPLALVVGADMPDLVPEVLVELILTASEEGTTASALAEGDGFRPLPCVVRTARAEDLSRALLERGEGSLRGLLEASDVKVVAEESWRALDPGGATLRDIDRPEDLDA